MKTMPTVFALLLASALPVLGTSAAHASDDVIRRGSCTGSTGSTDWKIKAKHDDGRIEVEAEIDSNRVGQTWTWVLRHNGVIRARGQSTTKAPSGSFEVARRTADAGGTDNFSFRAVNPRTGEVCVARVSL